jgi:F-type H+-transporting ATPase subunit b
MITDTTLTMPDATLVVELVAFLIVLLIMAKFVLPRLRAAVEQRQSSITNSLAAADDAERRRAAAEAEAQRILAAARRQARGVTDNARVTKDELITEGRREGLAEYRWRAGQFRRERQRDEELMRRRLAMEIIQALVDAIREASENDSQRDRVTALVAKAMMSAGGAQQDAWLKSQPRRPESMSIHEAPT